MPPELAAPVAVLAAAIAQAILMWAAWRFPKGFHRRDESTRNDDDAED